MSPTNSTAPSAMAATDRLTAEYLRLPRTAGRSPVRGAGALRRGNTTVPGRLSRPVFLDAAERAQLHRDLTALYDLLMALPGRLAGGSPDHYAALLGLTPAQAEAVRRTARPGTPRLARADLYRTADGFRVLEMNVTAALGGTGISWQARMYLTDPAVRAFVQAHGLRCVDTATLLADLARAGCPQADASGRPPVLAVIDSAAGYAADPTSAEFVSLMFAERGFTALSGEVSRLRRRAGGLWLDETRVDVVYRMFLLEELADAATAAEFRELVAAQEAGEVTMLLPLDVEAYGSKAALALLSDERHRAALDDTERALVDRLLPWTRSLDRPTLLVDGTEVDTLAHCLAHREELILKPNWLHGGAGILPGWTASPAEWHSRLTAALGGPYVVQRRVTPHPEPFPDPTTGAPVQWALIWGVFLVGDHFGGVSIRGEHGAGAEGVISQGNGAHLACCFSA